MAWSAFLSSIGASHVKSVSFPLEYSGLEGIVALSMTLVAVYATYSAVLSVYLIYFHPLSGFPGPRQACLSNNWLLKQSKTGQVEVILDGLHRKYGTQALRIGPNELHITDVSLYKTIYNQVSPFPKHGSFYDAFGTPHTVFVETDTKLHKERRRLLNPFFSKAAVNRLEPIIVSKVEKLMRRIDKFGPDEDINMYNAARCITADFISEYAFATCLDLLDTTDDNFHGGFLVAFDAVAANTWDFAYTPILRAMAKIIPRSIAQLMSKDLADFFALLDKSMWCLQEYRKKESQEKGQPVVFDALTALSDDDAAAEGIDILAAGSDTTAFTLSVAIWNIANNVSIQKRLGEEMTTKIPDPKDMPNLTGLERLGYLNACVKEAVRVAAAVPGRLPRIVPAEANNFVVDGRRVPPGSIIGMSAYTMHNSEEVWGPDAREFNPDRWLQKDSKLLEQNMVAFSKGLRSCLGQNLAYAELTLVLAYIFRNYHIKLSGESADATPVDLFTSMIKKPGLLAYLSRRSE